METSELRKLAEEKLNEKVQFKVNDGVVNLPLMLNAIIDAMLSFHEQASKDMYPKEFIIWKDFNCSFNHNTGLYICKEHDYWQDLPNLFVFYKDNIQGK